MVLAGAGVVAVSLIVSGALSWALISNKEVEAAKARFRQQVLIYRTAVNAELRRNPTVVPHLTNPLDEMYLVDSSNLIVDDSRGAQIGDTLVIPGRVGSLIQRGDLEFSLDSVDYIGAWATVGLPGRAGPRYALVVAEPRAAVVGTAATDLVGILAEAGVAGLMVAVVAALLISRTLSKPLRELARASEDIAAGQYSRRVEAAGDDEIGKTGRAFNRMADAVERARILQREFLANASHELKTPLTSLIGFSQAMTDGSLRTDAERARAAQIVHEEASRVLRLSQELLDLARVESGQMPMHPETVDLAALLEQEAGLLAPRALQRQLRVVLDLPSGLPPVTADPERLHQILDNLLDNAVKYAVPSSAIAIRAAASSGRVETAVENSIGPNLPDAARIFDRFYRAEHSRSTSEGGVGLGLAISRELALAQGGTLTAEVTAARTLLMRLTLPAAGVSGGRLGALESGGVKRDPGVIAHEFGEAKNDKEGADQARHST